MSIKGDHSRRAIPFSFVMGDFYEMFSILQIALTSRVQNQDQLTYVKLSGHPVLLPADPNGQRIAICSGGPERRRAPSAGKWCGHGTVMEENLLDPVSRLAGQRPRAGGAGCSHRASPSSTGAEAATTPRANRPNRGPPRVPEPAATAMDLRASAEWHRGRIPQRPASLEHFKTKCGKVSLRPPPRL